MRQLLALLPLLYLTACASDPLVPKVVEVPGAAPDDGFVTVAVTDPAALNIDHEDLTLRLSFRADAGAKGSLMLQGKYPLALPSLRVADDTPQYPVSVRPGQWHDLEVQYKAPADGTPALLSAVYLDGNAVYYQYALPATDAAPGPLRVETTAGAVELADVSYAPVAGRRSGVDADGTVMLNVPLLRYDYYHLPAEARTFGGWDAGAPVKSGYINRVDLNAIRDRGQDYAVRFTGQLYVPTADTYVFETWGPGATEFLVDGQTVAAHAGAPNDWQELDSLALTAGEHTVEIRIVQHHGWNVNRLGYRRSGTAAPLRYLNAMEERVAIATPAPPEPRRLATDDRPYLLRSFLYFPAPKLYEPATKRTHVISVGEGDGPHYTLDLRTGALLQLWRGEFADVHAMWDGRGEPQVMRPLGTALYFDGSPLVAPSATRPWPAAPADADDDFRHRAYELDGAGRPTFRYAAGGGALTDHLVPDADGLLRQLTNTGDTELNVQLAAARRLTETAPGEFELRGPGVSLRVTDFAMEGLTLQRSGGAERLVATLPPGGHVQYRLAW